MNGALQDILDGVYDKNIRKIGEWIKRANRPVYFRIGYEFDLPQNAYEPELYKKVFRYIVDHFKGQGVFNVAYVWHSAIHPTQTKDMMLWYPGDEYVDWVAISYFNSAQQQAAARVAQKARELKKPLMIAEATPAGIFTQKGKLSYLQTLFDVIEREDVRFVS